LILPWTILCIISASNYAVVLSPCFSRLDWLNRCTELCELQSSSQYHPQQHIQHNRFLECANRHRRLLSSRRSVPHYYDYWLIGLVVSRQGRVFAFYTRRTYSHILGEIAHYTAEAAYASLTRHAPPGGLHNVSNRTQVGSKIRTNFIHVTALYIMQDGILWVLDTREPTISESQASSMPSLRRRTRACGDQSFERLDFAKHISFRQMYNTQIR
jgi:hypothetical protein